MYLVRGRLDPELGAVLMRAVEAASDALFAKSSRDTGDGRRSGEEGRTEGARHSEEKRYGEEAPEPAQLRADPTFYWPRGRSLRALNRGWDPGLDPRSRWNRKIRPPVSGSLAERYQVVLHVEAASLAEEDESGLSELEDGTRFSAEIARRLACDAIRVEVRRGGDGSVLDVGRRARTIPPALRRVLDARDCGCRFPGCGLRFTDVHHIVHWADGGETTLGNTLLLCCRHHRKDHEGGYQVCNDRNGQVVFFTPKGDALFDAPPMPELPLLPEAPPSPELQPDLVAALVRGNRERGITPNFSSGASKWRRDGDIPWALEALDPWGYAP
jgi:hypothetical protein